MIYKLCIFARR